jgi:hypothetical protein
MSSSEAFTPPPAVHPNSPAAAETAAAGAATAETATAETATAGTVPGRPARRGTRVLTITATVTAILLLLFGLPWWTLLGAGTRWPAAVTVAGSVLLCAALLAFPVLMVLGHGRRHLDRAAATGDTILGVVWVLFSWSVLGNLARLVLAVGGLAEPARSRLVAVTVAAVTLVLAVWGYAEAMRAAGGPADRHALRPDQPGPLVGPRGRRGQRARRGHRLPHR